MTASDPAISHLTEEVLQHSAKLGNHERRIVTLEQEHTAATEAATAAAEAAERVAQHQEGFETSIHSALVQQRMKFAELAAAELDRAFVKYQQSKEARRQEQLEDDARAERKRKWILGIVVAVLGILAPALAALSNRLTAPPPAPPPAQSLNIDELAKKIDDLNHQRHDERK